MNYDNLTMQDHKSKKVIPVYLDPDDIQAKIEVNLNCKLWHLMYSASQLFNMKMSEFNIVTKSGAIDHDVYNDYMREFNLGTINL